MSTEILASWTDGASKEAIVAYVERVTESGSADFVPPDERVATFDNDGTLWCEKPIPIQLDFTLRRMAVMAEAEPTLRDQQPWKAAYEKDLHWLGAAMVKYYRGDDADVRLLLGAMPKAFEGMTIEGYDSAVGEFFKNANHPVLKRPYRSCGYQPMIELLRYLEDNGFNTYIASGGDRDFMRPVANALYGIPPERIIGSSQALRYQESDDGTDVLYKAEMEVFDDGPEKPVRIWSRIGRRPLVAGGNSNGDIAMLRFARTSARPALRLLLLHDDQEREFDYVAGAETALERAKAQDWTVISVKNDWTTVFAPGPAAP